MFIPVNHPDVRTGKKSEDEVLGEFLDTMDGFTSSVLGGKKELSLEDFVTYYGMVSFQIIDDKYFEIIISSSWGLSKSMKKEKTWTEDY
jgi:hypothetical protein